MNSQREQEIRFSLRVLMARKEQPVYNAMTPDTEPSAAVEYFTRRFGSEPEEVFLDECGLLMVGPVEDERC